MLQSLVLHKLRAASLSGYALAREIGQCTGHRPSYGSIYPLLERMTADGLIVAKADGRRKVYHLTPKGKKACSGIEHRRKQLAEEMRMRMRALADLLGQDPGPMDLLFERIAQGKEPLGKTTPAMLRLRDTMIAKAADGSVDRHARAITKLINDTTDRIVRLT